MLLIAIHFMINYLINIMLIILNNNDFNKKIKPVNDYSNNNSYFFFYTLVAGRFQILILPSFFNSAKVYICDV